MCNNPNCIFCRNKPSETVTKITNNMNVFVIQDLYNRIKADKDININKTDTNHEYYTNKSDLLFSCIFINKIEDTEMCEIKFVTFLMDTFEIHLYIGDAALIDLGENKKALSAECFQILKGLVFDEIEKLKRHKRYNSFFAEYKYNKQKYNLLKQLTNKKNIFLAAVIATDVIIHLL